MLLHCGAGGGTHGAGSGNKWALVTLTQPFYMGRYEVTQLQWVNDWYDGGYYSVSPSTNPLGPVSGSYRVLRGGSWRYNTDFVRSSYRSINSPGNTLNNIGFRVARNP